MRLLHVILQTEDMLIGGNIFASLQSLSVTVYRITTLDDNLQTGADRR